MKHASPSPAAVVVTDAPLRIAIGGAEVTLTPSEGLGLAEQLARKSFDQIARDSFADAAVQRPDRRLDA